MKNLIAFCLLLSLCISGISQSTIIKAGNLVLPENGDILQNKYIYVTNGRIDGISDNPEAGWEGEEIDLSDSWVLPGLMDCHVHITYNDPIGDFFPVKKYYDESTAFRAMRGLHNSEVLLNAGFTVVKDIGNDGEYATAAVIRAIKEGWFDGPTIIYAGKIISPFGGQITGVSPEQGPVWHYEYIIAETPGEMKKAIHENVYYGASVVKLVSDAFSYYYEQEMIEAAVKEADRLGMKVTVHVMGGDAARAVILGGAAAIEHGFMLDEELMNLMIEHGTYLVGTDFHVDHLKSMQGDFVYLQEYGQMIIDRLKLAYKIGVKMAFGTDVVVDLPGMNRAETNLYHLKTWKQAGIPAEDILKCMTTNAADLLGVDNYRGYIREGYSADIIAVREDPYQDIENLNGVHFVMKDGKIIRND